MTRADWTHRIATVAAYGGGGVGLAGALAAGLLLGEVELAKRTIRPSETPPPGCAGRYGMDEPGPDIVMALLGDSSAAGYGVATAAETPGALMASGLASYLHRPVDLRSHAVVGATSIDLDPQVARAVAERPDIAVIFVGGNDVTHLVKAPVAVKHLGRAVRALREIGAEVVVGTCPDLGTVRPLQPPLRWLARSASRSMAAAQTIAAVEAGGRTVSLGDLLGPHFARSPERMFSSDRFHPSAEGYRTAAEAVLPTLVAALSPAPGAGTPRGRVPIAAGTVRPTLPESGVPARSAAVVAPVPAVVGGTTATDDVRVLAHAAVAAAERPGTEVSAARIDRHTGTVGRLAQLRQRVRLRVPWPSGPA